MNKLEMSFTDRQTCLRLRLVIPAELLRAVNLFYDLYDEPEAITVSIEYTVTPMPGWEGKRAPNSYFPVAVLILPPCSHTWDQVMGKTLPARCSFLPL